MMMMIMKMMVMMMKMMVVIIDDDEDDDGGYDDQAAMIVDCGTDDNGDADRKHNAGNDNDGNKFLHNFHKYKMGYALNNV